MSPPVAIASRSAGLITIGVLAGSGALAMIATLPGPRAPAHAVPAPAPVPPPVAIDRVVRVADEPPPLALPGWATRPDHPARPIAGRVVDEDGAPIVATVHLRLAVRPELWRGVDVATDAHGRFVFGVLPAGVYHLVADAPGLSSRVVDIRTDGGAGNELQDGSDAELILGACTRVRGIVTAESLPVIGARITQGGVTLTRSGADGRFAACAAPGALDVRAPGFALADALFVQTFTGIEAPLWPTRRFVGVLRDAHGTPQPGVEVEADLDPRDVFSLRTAATTAQDGTFTLEFLTRDASNASLVVVPHGYNLSWRVADGSGTLVDLDAATGGGPPAFAMPDASPWPPGPPEYVAHVRGRLMVDGEPVGDRRVEIDLVEGGVLQTWTRSDGRFAFDFDEEDLGAVELLADDANPTSIHRRFRVHAGQRVQLGAIDIGTDRAVLSTARTAPSTRGAR